MEQYKDILLKTEFYKERIIKELIKSNVPITDERIDERIKRIDKSVAIFNHQNVYPEDYFDTEAFNTALQEIEQDLIILYRIAYELMCEKYNQVYSKINARLNDLLGMSQHYKALAEIESGSTVLGNNIYFSSSNFKYSQTDNVLNIDLGELQIRGGSRLTFLVKGHDILKGQAYLLLERSSSEPMQLAPYNDSQDTIKTVGDYIVNDYEIEINEDVVIDTTFEITNEDLTPSVDAEYFAFNYEDHVNAISDESNLFVERTDENYEVTGETVRFYIVNGTYAKFNFSIAPMYKNFDGYEIDNMSSMQKIEFNTQSSYGEIVFSVDTDGRIFGDMQSAVVEDEKLIYPEPSESRAFLLKEIKRNDPETYTGTVKIIDGNIENIDSIAIKELTSMEVIEG